MKVALFTDPHRGFNHLTNIILEKKLKSLDQSLFDIIIVSGDWGTTKLSQATQCFKMFRTIFPTKKILGVLGNHDLWDKETRSLGMKFRKIEAAAKEFDIHLLENNPYEINNYIFLGFDGWYYHSHYGRNTNDFLYIEEFFMGNTDGYLSKKADAAVMAMIDYPKQDKTVISITHFPCLEELVDKPLLNGNPRHGELLLEFSDLIVFGHSHKEVDCMLGDTRVINVGGDYNKPQYKIIDLTNLVKND
jgi:predicted phosphodiesterase